MTFQFRCERALIRSPLCVGLDPDEALLPPAVRSGADALLQFNLAIVDATCDLAGAYKPNLAFYEVHGTRGFEVLEATIRHIRSRQPDALIIADAKRGDIGNTSKAYAAAMFHKLGCDAVTVNPYMGRDSVEPYLEDDSKGAFVVCLTSNRGSSDFQWLDCGGRPLYEIVAGQVSSWNTRGNCGLVVGATQPERRAAIRKAAGRMPFLVPGVGAQGGDVETSVRINNDGAFVNAFINASRSILYASREEDFAEAARAAAAELLARIRGAGTHRP